MNTLSQAGIFAYLDGGDKRAGAAPDTEICYSLVAPQARMDHGGERNGMSGNTDQDCVVMFADVVGSTSLYESLGDQEAEARISEALEFVAGVVAEFRGGVVKTIGDEIMCGFDNADDAVLAGSEIQMRILNYRQADPGILEFRIGLHAGPVIVKPGDLFGDTVNVAARMAGMAHSGQIICSDSVVERLTEDIDYRLLNSFVVKGKSREVLVYDILYDENDAEVTSLFSSRRVLENKPEWKMNLNYRGASVEISKARPSVSVGRGEASDLAVIIPSASRTHCRLISRRGKVVLVDQSTNGTYVKPEQGEELFVHLEEIALTGSGCISLGIPSGINEAHLIFYSYC